MSALLVLPTLHLITRKCMDDIACLLAPARRLYNLLAFLGSCLSISLPLLSSPKGRRKNAMCVFAAPEMFTQQCYGVLCSLGISKDLHDYWHDRKSGIDGSMWVRWKMSVLFENTGTHLA